MVLYRRNISLGFADEGDGWILNEITAYAGSGWTLPSGIGPGSTEQEVAAAYPDAICEVDEGTLDDEPVTHETYSVRSGHLCLTVYLENGITRSISLGTYYEEPLDSELWDDTQPAEAYSFESSEITIYQKTDSGWQARAVTGKQAKYIGVLISIQELQPMSELGSAVYYLDFHNGTVAALCASDESGAVYTLTDQEAFDAALQDGGDPADALSLLEQCRFPADTWACVEAAFAGTD